MYYEKSAYGISDRLADLYKPIAVLCVAITSILLFFTTSIKWYLILLIAPFAAWMGPFAILFPIYILEMLIYEALHFKKVYKDVFDVIFSLLFIFGSMYISLMSLRFCAARFASPDTSTWEFAYVSESPNAHSYHYSENCKALRNTSYNIETLSIEEAEDYDYVPCNICLKESARYQWDDAVGLLFIPVSCMIYWLINKIDLFHKKYKFRNPIVKR